MVNLDTRASHGSAYVCFPYICLVVERVYSQDRVGSGSSHVALMWSGSDFEASQGDQMTSEMN